MSKYDPAREDGRKSYVVTVSGWGRKRDMIRYATTAAEARASYRKGTGEYISGVRRATPEDINPTSSTNNEGTN